MNEKTKIVTNVEMTKTVTLTGNDILMLLKDKITVPKDFILSETFVEVRIPGGGAWANTDLDIDAETPITVKYIFRK